MRKRVGGSLAGSWQAVAGVNKKLKGVMSNDAREEVKIKECVCKERVRQRATRNQGQRLCDAAEGSRVVGGLRRPERVPTHWRP